MNREQWLNQAVDELRELFNEQGEAIPLNLRVSCGWPSRGGTGKANATIGQCWHPDCSGDKTIEIFISPKLADPIRVLDVLTHELIHATMGNECGHKGPFKRLAVALGLTGKMTATKAGPELEQRLARVAAVLGDYPHAELKGGTSSGPKKQGTRLIRAECNGCGMVIRSTRTWIESVGLPQCACGGQFEAG